MLSGALRCLAGLFVPALVPKARLQLDAQEIAAGMARLLCAQPHGLQALEHWPPDRGAGTEGFWTEVPRSCCGAVAAVVSSVQESATLDSETRQLQTQNGAGLA
jgi:hypothetical protein